MMELNVSDYYFRKIQPYAPLFIFSADNDSLALRTFAAGNAAGEIVGVLYPLADNLVDLFFARRSTVSLPGCVISKAGQHFSCLSFPLVNEQVHQRL